MRQQIYLGELGLIAAVVGNMGLGSFIMINAPVWLLLVCAALAIGGILIGAWALVNEDADPARQWERSARKAEYQANKCIAKGMPNRAQTYMDAAAVARHRARVLSDLQAPRGAGKKKGVQL